MSNFEFGKWNVICDRCGRKYKNDEVTREWTGLIVCKDRCFEVRHPQDFVRSRPDDQRVEFTRPEPTDQFVDYTVNCSTLTFVELPNDITGPTTIYKGHVSGPARISGTVTVKCTLRID